jgi:hypothetical protein
MYGVETLRFAVKIERRRRQGLSRHHLQLRESHGGTTQRDVDKPERERCRA